MIKGQQIWYVLVASLNIFHRKILFTTSACTAFKFRQIQKKISLILSRLTADEYFAYHAGNKIRLLYYTFKYLVLELLQGNIKNIVFSLKSACTHTEVD